MFRRPSLPQLVGGLFHFLQQGIPVFRNKQTFYFTNHLVRRKIKLNQLLHHRFLRQDIHHADKAYLDEHAGHPVRQQGNLVHQHVRQTVQGGFHRGGAGSHNSHGGAVHQLMIFSHRNVEQFRRHAGFPHHAAHSFRQSLRGSGGFKRQFRPFPGKAVHYLYKYREMPVNFTVPAAGKQTDQ